jgi:hypothetical protein
MLWLVVASLCGALVTWSPPPDARVVRAGGALPRPSRAEVDLLLFSPERQVRSTDDRIRKMLEIGARRSSTFAGLLAALERTDVIVYIQPAAHMPSKLDGRLLLLPIANNQRYLRIQVRGDLSRAELIPLIAHELRHALEVAEQPAVRDQAAMIELYERIGETSTGPHAYDTPEARATGKQVRSELAGLVG